MLVEAAKQAEARGAPCFRVIGAADRSITGTFVNQAPTTYVNTGGGNVMAIPGAVTVVPVTSPRGDLTVRFMQECGNIEQAGVWSTQAVLRHAEMK